MLNSSSNFPSHTHTRWLSHLILGVLLVLPANPHGSVSTIEVYSSRLWPCLCRTGRHTSLSSVHSDARASRLLRPPPRLSASATCLKSPTPHIFWQRSAMLRTIWRARFFFPSVGGCHEGSAQSCQRERESPQKYQEAAKGAETCSRQTSTDQKPVKSLFSL